MKTKHLLKVLFLMAGLSFSLAASAQSDLDIYNLTGCTYDVHMKWDDGSGSCTVSYFMATVAPFSSFTFVTGGLPPGFVFHTYVVESGTSSGGTSVGDCSTTSCGCALPAVSGGIACGSAFTAAFGPATGTSNAVLKIY